MKFEDYERCFSKIKKGDLLFTFRGHKREAKIDAYYSASYKRWEVIQFDPDVDPVSRKSIYNAACHTIYCGTDFFFTRIIKAPRL